MNHKGHERTAGVRRLGSPFAFFAVAMLLVGCGTHVAPSPSASANPEFQAMVARAISSAEDGGASAQQLDTLHQAESEGEVSLSLARTAETGFFACLADSGIEFDDLGPMGDGRYPFLDYTFTAPDPAEADLCYQVEYSFVDALYQNQPQVVAEKDSVFLAKRDELVACIRANEVDVDADATVTELRGALWLLLTGDSLTDPTVHAGQDFVPVDCATPSGISTGDI